MSFKDEIDIRISDLLETCASCSWRIRHHGLRTTELEKLIGAELDARRRIDTLEALRDALYGE